MAMTQIPEKKRGGIRPFHVWVAALIIMLAVGGWGVYQTLWYGLQVTNLSDRVPWGLWITHDLSAIALGAGAFTLSAVVYLFRIERFKPMARIAVFVGFLGYTSAMLALAMDIGRPDRFWHPLVYWNVHSVLWEITLCVILYSTVLVIEVLPIVFDSRLFDNRPKWREFGHKIHKLTPVMAVMGLALSMLHQSSLGATYGVLSGRAIWYKPSMPVMFILSAVAGGVSATLLATMITSKLTNRELIDKFLRRDVARLAAFTLLAYLYLKLWDWAATSYYSQAPGTADALTRLQATTPYTQSFWLIEMLLCGLVPAVILLNRQMRRKEWPLMGALFLIVFGVIINRWNVTLSGLVVPPQWSPGVLGRTIAVAYTPSWVEIAVSVGVLGYAFLAFTLGAKYLPLFTQGHDAVAHAPTD